MASRTQANAYEIDKEKRDLAEARTADLKSKTNSREDNSYYRSRGYPNLATMTEAENSSEKRATNNRLTENAATNSKIEALKAMAIAGVGSPHSQAALDELAKIAGVKVPKPVDPKQVALDKVKKAKGIAVDTPQEEAPPQGATPQATPQQDQSLFQPQTQPGITDGLVAPAPGTQPVPSRVEGEASFGNPITPHLGTGGALMTPENPTGDPRNPWGAGGLFDNPTHAAAMNTNAREFAAHPYGSDNGPRAFNYMPGEPMDRLMGGTAPQPPNRLPSSPGLVAPPLTNYTPSQPQFNPSQLVQPQQQQGTPQKVNVDLDAFFRNQAAQRKNYTNF